MNIQKTIKHTTPVYSSEDWVIEQENGTTLHRSIVVKPPCVVALLIHKTTGKVILGDEWRTGALKIELALPAGMVDEGENAAEAAVREIAEETGYTVEGVVDLGHGLVSPGFTTEISHFFVAYVDGTPGEQNLDHDEKINVVEMEQSEFFQKLLSNEIRSNHTYACVFRYFLHKNEEKIKAGEMTL